MTPATAARSASVSDLRSITAFQSKPTSDKAERREKGRRHTSAVLIHMLNRNAWSHPDMEKLAVWALNEEGALHTSQVSHLRNGKTRLMGMKCLDALGQINLAVWCYNNGHKALLKKNLGCGQITEQIERLITDREAVMNPHTGLPIDQGDWLNIYLGLLEIPNVVNGPDGDASFAEAAAQFGVYIDSQFTALGLTAAQAVKQLTDNTGDADFAARIVMAAAGIRPFDSNELVKQIEPICNALNDLDKGKRSPQLVLNAYPWTE